MKHAGEKALDELEDLICDIRKLGGLRERRRGAFYKKAIGFLHFHEDPAGLFADLKVGDRFERFPVGTHAEREQLLARVRACLTDDSSIRVEKPENADR
ncbi:MAG: hypothetical protein DMF61_09045 [Blastocatellia bacterium AA13]|nr:MAG: hypothetical protein DMF61_09045 [Blastocatellia bacterium AA13]